MKLIFYRNGNEQKSQDCSMYKNKLSTVFNHRWENPNKYPGGLSIFLFVVTSKEVNIVVVICSRFGGLGLCWCGSAST